MNTRPLDHVAHLDTETRRLLEVVRGADLATPVPTCGGWTLADLLWHLTEVQDFWAWVVGTGATSPDDYPDAERPADGDLPDALDARRRVLVDLLSRTDPSAPAWSWSTDQTAGFTMRRQAHEALVHRLDAELALGHVPEVSPDLAADGIDELVTEFLSGLPSWATFHPTSDVVELVLTDRPERWVLRLGRITGTSPTSGTAYDLAAVVVDPTAPAVTQVRAPAAGLDAWLWGRAPDTAVVIEGDVEPVARLRAVIADATQ